MLKKVIKFEDFNGQPVEQTCYFHLSKSELIEYEVSKPGGAMAWIQRIIDASDGKALMDAFKELILMSYGKRTENGSGFRKNQELREEFHSSMAYDTLFSELITDVDAAAAFVNGIVPTNLAQEVQKMTGSTSAGDEAERVKNLGKQEKMPAEEKNVFDENAVRTLTPAEIISMDATELQQGLASGKFIIPQ